MSLMGLDIGTTGTKANGFSEDGLIIASGYREYPLVHPQAGWIELDAARVLRDAHDALAEAAYRARRAPLRARSISMLGEAAAAGGAFAWMPGVARRPGQFYYAQNLHTTIDTDRQHAQHRSKRDAHVAHWR